MYLLKHRAYIISFQSQELIKHEAKLTSVKVSMTNGFYCTPVYFLVTNRISDHLSSQKGF